MLDLGGSKKSGYHELIKGTRSISTVNIAKDTEPDFSFDLEKPFPLDSATYDGILCINTLEHIFNYRNVLAESTRVLKPGGVLVVAVPFLVPFHPSPNDYFRYSEQALLKMMAEAGFKETSTQAIGCGPFTASAQMRFNVLHLAPLRMFSALYANILDSILHTTVRAIKKEDRYTASYYPLGYVAIAKK